MEDSLKSEISMMRREKKKLWPWTVRKEVRYLAGQISRENGWLEGGLQNDVQYQMMGGVYVYLNFFNGRSVLVERDGPNRNLDVKLTLAEWMLLKKKFKTEYGKTDNVDEMEALMVRVETDKEMWKNLKVDEDE